MSDLGSALQAPETDNHDDDVRAAFEELTGAATNQGPSVVIDKDAISTRARDEQGRFAETPKDDNKPKRETLTLKDKPADNAQQPAAPQAAPIDPAVATLTQPAAQSVKAPEGLKPEFKAKFAELPPEWQAEIARRESESHKTLTKHDEERLFGKRINELSAPYLPVIRTEGATVEKAFENYLQTAYALRTGSPLQKAQALHAIAHQFNVDLNLPLQQGASDPQYIRLEREISDLKSQLQGQTQQRQLQDDQSLRSQIEEFASKPGHEHFETVRTKMGALIDSGEAKDLEDAYNQAVWLHPEIRSSLISAQVAQESEKRLTEQKAKADAARNASVSITGAPGAYRPVNGTGSLGSIEDDLRAAMRDREGRI